MHVKMLHTEFEPSNICFASSMYETVRKTCILIKKAAYRVTALANGWPEPPTKLFRYYPHIDGCAYRFFPESDNTVELHKWQERKNVHFN